MSTGRAITSKIAHGCCFNWHRVCNAFILQINAAQNLVSLCIKTTAIASGLIQPTLPPTNVVRIGLVSVKTAAQNRWILLKSVLAKFQRNWKSQKNQQLQSSCKNLGHECERPKTYKLKKYRWNAYSSEEGVPCDVVLAAYDKSHNPAYIYTKL